MSPLSKKQATCTKSPCKYILEQINTSIQLSIALKQENSNLIWKTIGLRTKDCFLYWNIFNYEFYAILRSIVMCLKVLLHPFILLSSTASRTSLHKTWSPLQVILHRSIACCTFKIAKYGDYVESNILSFCTYVSQFRRTDEKTEHWRSIATPCVYR